jgi:hypothetical protein
MTVTKYTHPKDCPDAKGAAADRKQHEAARLIREARLQAFARAEWLDWYRTTPRR